MLSYIGIVGAIIAIGCQRPHPPRLLQEGGAIVFSGHDQSIYLCHDRRLQIQSVLAKCGQQWQGLLGLELLDVDLGRIQPMNIDRFLAAELADIGR